MDEDEILGEWTDPIGRTIILTNERWNGHVLARHPEMEFLLKGVGETIESPEFIYKDRGSRLYYGLLHPDKVIKVVVEFKSEAGGRIITAHFFSGRLDTRGELEWTGI